MLLASFALLLLSLAPVQAAEDPPREDPPPAAGAQETQGAGAVQALDAAILDYLNGDLEIARLSLIRLSRDPQVMNDPDLLQRVRLYLGEVLYVMGDRDTSWETFVALALEDPDYQMDPFVHPPDVVTFFDSARQYARRFLPPEQIPPLILPEPPPPLPLFSALLPGRLQFYNQQPALGYAVIGGLTGAGAGAVGLGLYIRSWDRRPEIFGVNVPNRAELEQLETLRVIKNLSTGVAVGAWSVGVLQGAMRASRAPLSLSPSQDGAQVVARIRW